MSKYCTIALWLSRDIKAFPLHSKASHLLLVVLHVCGKRREA